MKIHLIKKKSVYDYVEGHTNSAVSFEIWLKIIRTADWNEPNDILNSFRNADILGKGTNRVVFDIGGNKYRSICTYYFGKKMVHLFINWIGTHADYDKLCKDNNQFTIAKY